MITHFIMIYSVLCKNLGTQALRKDYCTSGPSEIKYLEPLSKSVGTDAVAVFKIKYKVK